MFRFSSNNKCSGSPLITNVSCESESSLRLFWRKPKVKKVVKLLRIVHNYSCSTEIKLNQTLREKRQRTYLMCKMFCQAESISIVSLRKLATKYILKQRNLVFATNSDFLIPTSLQPNVVDLSNFKQ